MMYTIATIKHHNRVIVRGLFIEQEHAQAAAVLESQKEAGLLWEVVEVQERGRDVDFVASIERLIRAWCWPEPVSMPVPTFYRCSKCSATNCKLWRSYMSIRCELFCARCAAAESGVSTQLLDADGRLPLESYERELTDQIGRYVPAVPVKDAREETYWGYTSVPEDMCEWWRKLPTFPSPPAARSSTDDDN